MRSKLAEGAERRLLEAARGMTREQRLAAFVVHCENMRQLYEAGERMRRQSRSQHPSTAPTEP